jgi:sugar lactone lactonase YvrE
LCSDGQGGLYIADHFNDRVLHAQHSGVVEVFLGPLFSDGHSTSRLNCPADVAVSSDGVLFVADRGSGRILSCKSKGMATILVSDLEQPYALATRADLLYIAEFGRNRVLRMLLGSGSMSALLDIRAPTGLCFDAIGKLYVTERDLNRVLCFEPLVV